MLPEEGVISENSAHPFEKILKELGKIAQSLNGGGEITPAGERKGFRRLFKKKEAVWELEAKSWETPME